MVYAVAGPQTRRRVVRRLQKALEGRAELVVERRDGDRRAGERRTAAGGPPSGMAERRRVRAPDGRRVADRRALAMPVSGPLLPRRLRRFSAQLLFVSPLAVPPDYLEATATARTALAAQAGDREAMLALYEAHFDLVHAFAHTSLADAAIAEAATLEVFAEMLREIESFEPAREPFRVWLFRIAIDAVRALGTGGGAIAPARTRVASTGEALSALRWVSDGELRLLVERLPAAQRELVLLCHLAGFPTVVAADLLGIAPDRAAGLHRAAMATMAGTLAGLGRAQDTMQREHMRRLMVPSRVLRDRRLALKG
jgi:DNA-directed RNA polymerase specialized sigma24 family protein